MIYGRKFGDQMSRNSQELNFKSFIDEIRTNGSNKISLLCGNGLHDALFLKNDLFKLTNDDYKEMLKQVCKDIEDISKKQDIQGAEEFFRHLRILYGMKIFDKFQSHQNEISTEISINKFLKQFKSIYTLNYDVLLYRSFFNPDNDSDLADGFKGEEQISIKEIKNRLLQNPRPSCYFLHGAFHLLYNCKDKTYKKIKRKNEVPDLLTTTIVDEYSKIKSDYMKGKVILDPLVVFASRHDYKYGAICSDEYLRFCLEELAKESGVFTFGCSFKNDQHILDTLLKGEDKRLYFGFYNDDDKERIQEYISKNPPTSHEIVYINLKENHDYIQKILKNGF